MIDVFESMVRMHPGRVCFAFVDERGREERYTYRQVRLIASGLARRLQESGVRRGDCVAVDLPNCPAFVLLLLACAYASFTLVPINHRLTTSEKQARLLELKRQREVCLSYRVDEARAERLLSQVRGDLTGLTDSSGGRRARVIMGARRDAEEEAIHFAERQAHLFDYDARALIMFTSGTTGKSKAVPLDWRRLTNAARASNTALNRSAEGLWQAALPLYHIGGLQVVVRSILNRNPFILYEHFDARRVLQDALQWRATHISVVDKMLQDLLSADEHEVLRGYRCVLLGGGALNRKTLARAYAAKVRVYASYGMTETASQIAHAPVDRNFEGGLVLLPGYKARIVDANAEGYGRLAVSGPGVFAGYLNARAALTVDGYFLTGDTAAFKEGRLYLKERTSDMFVSGGENVYPAEIVDKLMRIDGVADAHVFGAPDPVWGRRPIAFVERDDGEKTRSKALASGKGQGLREVQPQGSHLVPDALYASLRPMLSKLYLPRQIFMMDELPRTGIGKIDRVAIECLYEQRIEIKRVNLYHVRLPFKTPFKTAKATLTHRDSLIVEVVDHAGRTGLGECVAFATDWYLPETLGHDASVLRKNLIPQVLSQAYLHPRDAALALNAMPEAAALPLARGALEPALWDLYGKIVGKPLWKLVCEEAQRLGLDCSGVGAAAVADAGAVVGLGTVRETLTSVESCVNAGYRRVKLKVAPGSAACVKAVRQAFPDLLITLDANQSFGTSDKDREELRALDACAAAWIEEPLVLGGSSRNQRVGRNARVCDASFGQLACLQRSLSTPICLDESFTCPEEAYRALDEYPDLRCFAVKVGKFGGVLGALEFIAEARSRGAQVWMGGMYDTGISKRLHAAFQMLPGVDVPGDVGATSRYFTVNITDPPYSVERGTVTLNREGHRWGLGCDLCPSTLSSVLVKRISLE